MVLDANCASYRKLKKSGSVLKGLRSAMLRSAMGSGKIHENCNL